MLASHGLTDRQIAAELGIRPGTINTHWSRIRLKLGAATRSEAVSILLNEKAENSRQEIEAEKQSLLDEVHQRREVEDELRENRRQLQLILNNAPAIIWSVDAQGQVLAADGKLANTFGVRPNSSGKNKTALLERVISKATLEKATSGEDVNESTTVEGIAVETRLAPIMEGPEKVYAIIGVTILALPK